MATLEKLRAQSPSVLTTEGVEMAKIAQRCIMESLDHSRAAAIHLTTSDGDSVALPPQALRLIGELLGLMAERKPVTLLPSDQELTTVEAANLLNVSRPFVIKEIEGGRLGHRMVGSHRRISIEDLTAYQRTMRDKQAEALNRLAEESENLGLDY